MLASISNSNNFATSQSDIFFAHTQTMTRYNEFAQRFNALVHQCEAAPKTQTKLAKWLNVSQSFISQMKSGEKLPSMDKAITIAEKLGCTVQYLLTGYIQKMDIDDGVIEGEIVIRQLPDISEAANHTHQNNRPTLVAINRQIPLLSWVRAGQFCEAPEQFSMDDAEEHLPNPVGRCGPRTFALTVIGDSMDVPDGYREGEIVYIDPDLEPTHGKDVLARTASGNTLKRYKIDEAGPYLLQLNGNIIIRPQEHWCVCGVVIFSGRKR